MTTDTKAVADGAIGYYENKSNPCVVVYDVGRYVHIEDHEQVVAELRAALAAKSAEVEGLVIGMQEIIRVHANDNHRPKAFYIAAKAIEAAMENSNEHQDQ